MTRQSGRAAISSSIPRTWTRGILPTRSRRGNTRSM
nr:MAG TPA: hypothetical protein [Caudoviricetes sp.]